MKTNGAGNRNHHKSRARSTRLGTLAKSAAMLNTPDAPATEQKRPCAWCGGVSRYECSVADAAFCSEAHRVLFATYGPEAAPVNPHRVAVAESEPEPPSLATLTLPALPFAETSETKEAVEGFVFSLGKAFEKADSNFATELGKHNWWSDVGSVFYIEKKQSNFDLAKKQWITEVTAAIDKRFDQLVEPGVSPRAVVKWAYDTIGAVLSRYCRPAEVLKTIVALGTELPPEIGDGCTPESLSGELMDSIQTHLEIKKSDALGFAVLDARADKDHTSIEHSRTKPSPVSHRAEWPRALYQAVVSCGPDAPYQVVANWISENHPYVQATESYARKDEQDLGVLVRTDEKARAQFQKDLNKARKEYRQTYPTRT